MQKYAAYMQIYATFCIFIIIFAYAILKMPLYAEQNNVHTNTKSVQCISIVYSICLYKYNQ